MKNSFYAILFILAAGQLCRVGLPWWGLAPVAAMAGFLFPQAGWRGFLSGFAGGFLLWFLQAWMLDSENGSLLSGRVGQLFVGLSSVQLLLLTGSLGGLLAGLGALTGTWGRDLVGHPAKAG